MKKVSTLALKLCKMQTATAKTEIGGLKRCYCEEFEKIITKFIEKNYPDSKDEEP